MIFIVEVNSPSDADKLAEYGKVGNPTSLPTLIILETDTDIETIRSLEFVKEAFNNEKAEIQDAKTVSTDNWILGELSQQGSGKGVTICVIDDGVREDHIEFEGRVDLGWSFDDKFYNQSDTHGTRVAGVAAGKTVGVSPDARLEVYRTEMMLDQIIKSLDIALTRHRERDGNTIVNMSFVFQLPLASTAFTACKDEGMILVGGAGNDGAEYTRWPAAFDTVLSVGAYDENRVRSSFSNKAQIYAPGEGGKLARPTFATSYYNNRMHTSGTSFSTPFVAGVIASILPPYKLTTAFEVDKIIEELFKQSTDLGWAKGSDFKYQVEQLEKPPVVEPEPEPPVEEPFEPEDPPVEEPEEPDPNPPPETDGSDKKKKDKKKKRDKQKKILIAVVLVVAGLVAYHIMG